jgi:nitroreductase
MRVEEAISGRRSVREYTGEVVDEPTLRRLIDASVKAPNAVNDQPWAFTVVRDQALLNRISREAKTHMLETTPPGGRSEHFRVRLSDPEFHVFYHAPTLVVISAVSDGPWIVEDCSLAAENLMLAAYSEHLGTCWIGFAQGFLNTPAGKSLVGAPAASIPIAPIIVGKPKALPPPVPRKEPEIRWIG